MVFMLLLSMTLALASTTAGMAAEERSVEISLLGGTVLSLDPDASSVTLQMPSGEPRLFVLVDQRLLRNVAIGDHVTFELNEAAQITKLVKLPTDPAN